MKLSRRGNERTSVKVCHHFIIHFKKFQQRVEVAWVFPQMDNIIHFKGNKGD